MKYVVFEAGSRAGFSAEMFFIDYVNQTGKTDDVLYMVDDSLDVNEVVCRSNIKRINFYDYLDIDKKGLFLFPADELSRQSKSVVYDLAKNSGVSEIDYIYYYKESINNLLNNSTKGCKIKIPKTFDCTNICVRPNTMSAGSKGIQLLSNVSITERINIKQEYVVDVIRSEDSIEIYPRAVVLKNGYDRLIKPLQSDSYIGESVKEFVMAAAPKNEGLFSNIFHLQLAEDINGDLYYIESSKRISGTSIVNIFRGMNPFCFINGVESKERNNPFKYGKWYRYEDFIKELDI